MDLYFQSCAIKLLWMKKDKKKFKKAPVKPETNKNKANNIMENCVRVC